MGTGGSPLLRRVRASPSFSVRVHDRHDRNETWGWRIGESHRTGTGDEGAGVDAVVERPSNAAVELEKRGWTISGWTG